MHSPTPADSLIVLTSRMEQLDGLLQIIHSSGLGDSPESHEMAREWVRLRAERYAVADQL